MLDINLLLNQLCKWSHQAADNTMTSILSTDNAILDIFISITRSNNIEHNIFEYGNESWTYGNLDAIFTRLAPELHQKYGPKPVVTLICKNIGNHPYVLATLFAICKLGGIFSPFNGLFPRDISERRLHDIVLVPFIDSGIQDMLNGDYSHFLIRAVFFCFCRF